MNNKIDYDKIREIIHKEIYTLAYSIIVGAFIGLVIVIILKGQL